MINILVRYKESKEFKKVALVETKEVRYWNYKLKKDPTVEEYKFVVA